MNVTHIIPDAGSPQGASQAQAANSSLAGFLLADSPANSGQDFRAIAAALFSVDSSIPSPDQPPAASHLAAKLTAGGQPRHEPESGKSKQLSDSTSAASDAELTVPASNVPQPLIEVAPRPKVKAGTLGAPEISEPMQAPTPLTGGTKTEAGHSRAALTASQQNPIPSPAAKLLAVPALFNQPPLKEQATPAADTVNKLPPRPGGSAPLLEPPATADHGKPTIEVGPHISSASAADTSAKKSATEGPGESGAGDPAKPASAQAANANVPAFPADERVASAVQPPPATDSTTTPAALETASIASARQILDSSMTAKVELQSAAVKPGLTPVKDVIARAAPGGPSKTKGDRASKDTRIDPPQGGKFTHADGSNGEVALTRSDATNSKDIAGEALTTTAHSDSHSKSAPPNASVTASSAQTAMADADGPDEALPTSAPLPVTAKLVQGMSQSEFRVGMQSPEFGNIDIRTSVARHMFSAQISVEHSDMAKSMTADLPALYHRLADQQVRVANIVIQGQSLGTSSGLARDTQSQDWRPQNHSGEKSDTQPVLPTMTTEAPDSAGRLDVRI